ncbi:MAG: type IV-A pilus assembly ATPase PilB [bacterium]
MIKKNISQLKKRLGDILIEVGVLTREQLNETLAIQKKEGGRLGTILMKQGIITEDVLLAFLGKQCGVNYVSLEEYPEIQREVIDLVQYNIAKNQVLIPLKKEGKVLTIAMADPLNVFALDDLRMMTGCDIDVVIASSSEIFAAIEKYYASRKAAMNDPDSDPKVTVEVAKDDRGFDRFDYTSEDLGASLGSDSQMESETLNLDYNGHLAPVIKIVNGMLANAVKAYASDIHVEPFEKVLKVRYRIDGVLQEQPSPPKKVQHAIIARIKIMSQLDIAEKRLPQDGRIKIKVQNKEVDLRVSTLPTAFGEKVVMRILDSSGLKLDLSELGFEKQSLELYKNKIAVPYGIVLVTGPTGSGKTTTLYSTLSTLNSVNENIMTIEDPVEYILEGINQVHARPDIGLTFAAGLRSFLRQDPDIIMVGEIRDTETAEIAINAALTGHLVFSTLHTNDAPGAVTRLNNMGIEPFLTASTVNMVVAQRLVRTICKKCKENYEVPVDNLIKLGLRPVDAGSAQTVVLARGRGCENCSNTGYRGRLSNFEVMDVNDEIKELILERASTTVIKQAARKAGMITLREAALRKVLNGITTVEEMIRVTYADSG